MGAAGFLTSLEKGGRMTAEQPTQPWYAKTWVVILALWLFFPVGLYLMWRFTRWEVWVKTVVSVIISLFVILMVVSAAIGGDETDDDEVTARDVTPSPTVDVEATQTASAVEAATATAAAEEEGRSATATAEAGPTDATATAEASGIAATATAEALALTATATASAETEATPTPEPVENVLLATDIAGGWLNIDFLWTDDPLQEAKQCVKSHADNTAVACFAFASQAAYEASEPESAGNFKGPLCYDARWQRNKEGYESGGETWAKDVACPN